MLPALVAIQLVAIALPAAASDEGTVGDASANTAPPSAVVIAPPGTSGSTAATGTTVVTKADDPECSNQPTTPYATGLPVLPCFPARPGGPTQYLDYGAVVEKTTQDVPKAKIKFDLPVTVARTFLVICNSASPNPCPPGLALPPQDTSVTSQYFGTIADVYIQADAGTDPQFGTFPVQTISTLGFGSLPVSATITIRQPIVNGVAQPLKLAWFASNGVTPGKTIPGYEQYGPAPPVGPTGQFYFFTPDAHVRGQAVLTVTDVKVDGVPLDVGTDCSATADLDLRSTGGFYVSGSAPVLGQPGDYAALGAGGFLHQYDDPNDPEGPADGVTIPPFTGCVGADGENVSALVSGMVSGDGNSVIAQQRGGLVPFACIDPTIPNCGTAHPATVKVPE